ncbi:MAG: flavodoxin domain-containing protein [Planctomycetota bacterium]|nr:flavodoxin domain-containing protein [Planctomycetota bacterium]
MIEKLADGVYWVGVVDWSIRHFHGYELSVHRGTTYNAYLVVDEKIALVDTVWGPYRDRLIENIRQVTDPSKIDIVVVNHSEPDHSGALPLVMHWAPKAEVVVSKRGMDSVPGHYHERWNFRAAGTGDRISLGRRELVFVEAPMLHWPDSMFTYLTGSNILMPNDAFGQHYATDFRFNDQVDRNELYCEALKYYANILTPFSDRVAKKISELLDMKLPVDMIAPSHGVIWRKDPMQIVEKYREWAEQIPEERAVIVYDTMWEATRLMAEAIGEGLAAAGVPHRIFRMALSDRNDVLAEIFRSKAVIVGSPVLNGGLLPSVSPILEDIEGLKFKNKIGAAFGSYGWSGECVKLIEERLTGSGVRIVAPGVRAKWQPKPGDLDACRKLGAAVAAAVRGA